MKKAILVVGHGSKSAQAVADFEGVVGFMQEKYPTVLIKGAHMELAKPSIEETVKVLWGENVRDITVVPYFLFNGNHIKHDIPEIIAQLVDTYDGLQMKMAKPIGANPIMADVLWKRATECNPDLA